MNIRRSRPSVRTLVVVAASPFIVQCDRPPAGDEAPPDSLAALLTGVPVGGQEVVVADRVGCPSCTLRFEPQQRIGEVRAGALPHLGTQLVQIRGGLLLAGTYDPGIVHVLNTQGMLQRTFGSRGSGPGEFMDITLARRFSADSVLLFDAENARMTILSSETGGHRSFRFPHRVNDVLVLPDRRIVVSSPIPTGGGFDHLHFLSPDGEVLASFAGSNEGRDLPRRLSASPDGGFFAAHRWAYLIEEYSGEGELIRSFRRNPDWFALGDPGDSASPRSRVDLIHSGEGGLLWIFIRNVREDYVPPQASPGDARPTRSPSGVMDAFEWIVEVIDPTEPAVVHRDRTDRFLRGFLDAQTAFELGEAPTGETFLQLIRVGVARP